VEGEKGEAKGNRAASQIRMGAGLTRYVLKATFRNKAGYFFSFIFPVVFVVAFGLLGTSRPVLKLGISATLDGQDPVIQALEQMASEREAPIELVRGSDRELERQLRQGRIAGIIAREGRFKGKVAVITSSGSPHGGAAAENILKGILADLNLRAAGIARPSFQVERREIAGQRSRFIDFALPGQIGFSMLSLATFGVGFTLSTLRKTLVLKRLLATAVYPLTFVVALCLGRSVQAVVQAAAIIAIGVFAFGFSLAHGWITFLEMLLLSFLGIMAFLGYGILISNVARDEQTLPVVLNLFNLPQVVLGGVFFPIDTMPPWLQAIGSNLPLAYLNISLRKAAGEGLGLVQLWPYLLGMFAWGVVAYLLAARTFHTE
jgi:ABC-2 type transport system permease protein